MALGRGGSKRWLKHRGSNANLSENAAKQSMTRDNSRNWETLRWPEPVQRSVHVFGFSFAVAVLSFTQPKAAKIEAQHRKSKTVERLHSMKHDFVVHGPAKYRVRMAYERRMGGVLSTRIEQRFQLSRRTIEH